MTRNKLLGLAFLGLCVWPISAGEGQVKSESGGRRNSGATKAYSEWSVPSTKRIRLIIDADAANESDDQVVIAHALLTSTFIMKGLVAAHFTPHTGASPVQDPHATMKASFDETNSLLRVMRLDGCVPVAQGAARPFASANRPASSDGADLIIREALAEHPRPLYVAVLGPLTNLAAAYVKEPRIAERLTAIWMGGAPYPDGGPSFNQDADRIAANIVMESKIPLWQVSLTVPERPRLGMAEVIERIAPQGDLGYFLFGRINRFWTAFPHGTEFFVLSDAAVITLLLQQPWLSSLGETRPAPSIDLTTGRYLHNGRNRPIRVYGSIGDQRPVVEDIFSKLVAFARGEIQPSCN